MLTLPVIFVHKYFIILYIITGDICPHRMSWNMRDTDVQFLHLWSACRHSNCSIDWHMTADFTFSSAGKLQVVYETATSLAYV